MKRGYPKMPLESLDPIASKRAAMEGEIPLPKKRSRLNRRRVVNYAKRAILNCLSRQRFRCLSCRRFKASVEAPKSQTFYHYSNCSLLCKFCSDIFQDDSTHFNDFQPGKRYNFTAKMQPMIRRKRLHFTSKKAEEFDYESGEESILDLDEDAPASLPLFCEYYKDKINDRNISEENHTIETAKIANESIEINPKFESLASFFEYYYKNGCAAQEKQRQEYISSYENCYSESEGHTNTFGEYYDGITNYEGDARHYHGEARARYHQNGQVLSNCDGGSIAGDGRDVLQIVSLQNSYEDQHMENLSPEFKKAILVLKMQLLTKHHNAFFTNSYLENTGSVELGDDNVFYDEFAYDNDGKAGDSGVKPFNSLDSFCEYFD